MYLAGVKVGLEHGGSQALTVVEPLAHWVEKHNTAASPEAVRHPVKRICRRTLSCGRSERRGRESDTMIVTTHPPIFLPWPGFFYKAWRADTMVLLDTVQFPLGRSWMTRNRLKSDQGELWPLTSPACSEIATADRSKYPVRYQCRAW